MILYKAPDKDAFKYTNQSKFKVFLAGSIEQDKAEKWQDEVVDMFSSLNDNFVVLNPRRDHWHPEWTHEDKEFKEQVKWELDCLAMADSILMYFDPKTLSPITLLELGLFAESMASYDPYYGNLEKKIKVVCPDGYWRKGNVLFVCDRYDLKMYDDIVEASKGIKQEFMYAKGKYAGYR